MQIEFFLRKKHINSIRTKINISLYKQQRGRTQELIQGRGGGLNQPVSRGGFLRICKQLSSV